MEASAVRAAVATFVLALALALRPALVRGQREPDFDRMLQQQAETDKTWRAASGGFMQMDKITYRSKAGDLDIPAFVFQPVKLRGAKAHPAIVWVDENIRGHLYEHYENTREQRDSWNRVWTFLDWKLDPFHAELRPSTR